MSAPTEAATGNEAIAELDLDLLRGPVTDRVAVPSTKSPDYLPFHERGWKDFERIVLVVAEYIDGLTGVRLYGVPGQLQHGIDLYGSDRAGQTVGYQAKQVSSFYAKDLEAAVDKFGSGFRPVAASKLVVCVGCITDRTEISEELEQLKVAKPFEIELYDRSRLSEKLKGRPDLVRRLFGEEWANAFCRGIPWPIPKQSPSERLADALVRGPTVALGLREQLDDATRLADTDPERSATLLALVIDRLKEEGFKAASESIELRLCDLLMVVNKSDEAIETLIRLAWERIDSGSAHWERTALRRLKEIGEESNNEKAKLFLSLADGIAHWYGQPRGALHEMVVVGTAVFESGTSVGPDVILWLLEQGLGQRDENVIRALIPLANRAVSARGALGLADPLSIRLRAAIADIDGDWNALSLDARVGRLGPTMATLVHMRFGRWLMMTGQPASAEAEYFQGIQRAASSGLTGEAAAGMRAIITLRSRYGPLTEEINSMNELSFELDATGFIGLRDGRDPLDSGYGSLAKEKLPQALRSFKTALRISIMRGDCNAETQAQLGLVEVLLRAGEGMAALELAIQAGSTKDAKKCMPLPDYIDLRTHIVEGPYWKRATAMLAASLQNDLLPDDHIREYALVARNAVDEERHSLFSPHVDLNAWKLLASISERLNEEEGEWVLNQLEGRIKREANHYRHEDDEHIALVISIAHISALTERASHHLARIVSQGDHFGDTARREIGRRLNPVPQSLIDDLSALADDGNRLALETLDDLGIVHRRLLEEVEKDVQTLLAAPPPPPGTYYFGTMLPRTAVRALSLEEDAREALASHCAKRALNVSLPESNRTEGAEGVLILARGIRDSLRDDLFETMIHLAESPAIPSEVDLLLSGGAHPLSHASFDLDSGSLPGHALRAAARLSRSKAQALRVVSLAVQALFKGEQDVYSAAHAISYLERSFVELDLNVLLAHPNAFVRQLVAVLAVELDPPDRELLVKLANDPDPSVRRSLASGLSKLEEVRAPLKSEVERILRKDRFWSVRRLVAPEDLVN